MFCSILQSELSPIILCANAVRSKVKDKLLTQLSCSFCFACASNTHTYLPKTAILMHINKMQTWKFYHLLLT